VEWNLADFDWSFGVEKRVAWNQTLLVLSPLVAVRAGVALCLPDPFGQRFLKYRGEVHQVRVGQPVRC
jgi:hypothetical protein